MNSGGRTLEQHCRHWLDSEAAKNLIYRRLDMGLPSHIRPWSTFIAAMGDHWHPGCKEAVEAMAQRAWEEGYDVCLHEEQERCFRPMDSLGTMRNNMYRKALLEGWEYILYVDNDVQPPPDALVKLLRHPVSIVAPITGYIDGKDYGLDAPKMARNRGLVMITSCVLSMLLFRTAVFAPWITGAFWEDSIGASEAYHFQKLALIGHYPFIDTGVMVTCVKPPHFPLSSVKRTAEEQDGALR